MDEKNFLFEWRDAIKGEDGPESPITRLVLLMLSLHMDLNGDSCFPSQRLLSRETGLALSTVNNHLQLAEEDDWLIRDVRLDIREGEGRSWKRHYYTPNIPEKVLEEPVHVNGKVLAEPVHVKHVKKKGVSPHEKGVSPHEKGVSPLTLKVLAEPVLSSSVNSSMSSSKRSSPLFPEKDEKAELINFADMIHEEEEESIPKIDAKAQHLKKPLQIAKHPLGEYLTGPEHKALRELREAAN